MARKQYLGGVAASALASDINNSATAIVLTAGTGAAFPTAASFAFPIVVGRGTAFEEEMLCTARSTDTLTVTRAHDSTTAVAHLTGATVEVCIDAKIIDDLSVLLWTLTTQGDLPYATAAGTWARLAKGTALQALGMNAGATAPAWMASLQSLLTAKGMLVGASAANTPGVLSVGSDGQVVVADAASTLGFKWAAASPVFTASTAEVVTTETLAGTSYADLSTAGPAVTVTTGTKALVIVSAYDVRSTSASGGAYMSYAVSGATTSAAADKRALYILGLNGISASKAFMHTGLTAGSNVFTAKYRAETAGSATYTNRLITVIDLGS